MTYTEILDLVQRYTNTQNTTTSSYPLAAKTVDINNALNKFMLLAIASEGKWQVDDSNQTDYPIITTNLVSSQQDYSFATDQDGNQILDIYRVELLNSSGIGSQLIPLDKSELTGVALTEFMKTAGTPLYYDKTANGIFLYPAPNYNYTNGLKIYCNRTSTYFTVSDTTKKAGIPWTLHEYLALRPSYYYCLSKGLPQTAGLAVEMLKFEGDEDKGITGLIPAYYSKRAKDEPQQIRIKYRRPR